MKTGIQVSSLKPLLKTEPEVRKAFARMKALGCDTVQLQWIDPSVTPEQIARAMALQGIRSVSWQDFYELIRENEEYYVNLNAATGGTWLCVSRIPERLKSPAGLDVFVGELREMQQRLSSRGQKLCFHPVSADFRAVPGMDAVEYLFRAMPELDICLDLYHLWRNCADMPGYIRRYAGRVCMVHFKDGLGDRLVPAGQGSTDWTGVVEACLETGVPYGFVEQETWNRDPYLCMQEALDFVDGRIRAARG